MQDTVIPTPLQPIYKLAQANMELLTRFWTSPELSAPAADGASSWFQQATEWSTRAMRSEAYGELVSGMMKNYTDFLVDLGQSGMAVIASAQSAMPDLSRSVPDVADARARRARQAA